MGAAVVWVTGRVLSMQHRPWARAPSVHPAPQGQHLGQPWGGALSFGVSCSGDSGCWVTGLRACGCPAAVVRASPMSPRGRLRAPRDLQSNAASEVSWMDACTQHAHSTHMDACTQHTHVRHMHTKCTCVYTCTHNQHPHHAHSHKSHNSVYTCNTCAQCTHMYVHTCTYVHRHDAVSHLWL